MKAVDVLFRLHRGIDDFLADVAWERGLDEDAMQASVVIQFRKQLKQNRFAGVFRQDVGFGKNVEFTAGLLLATDVNLGGRIFSDANESQTGLDAASF